MKVSRWKIEHPSDTEDERNVGLSSEDEAEGLETAPGVARRGTGLPAARSPNLLQFSTSAACWDEVIVKKRALQRMKQQMSALLRGEDLPEGAQGREVTEVPYEVPSVPRGETTCPVCRQQFKSHHRVMVHMGVHRGEKFPCGKCGKVLASRRYWRDHTQSCVEGVRLWPVLCVKNLLLALSPCATTTGLNMGPILWCHQGVSNAHIVARNSKLKRHGLSTSHIVLTPLTERGLSIVGLLDVRQLTTPSPVFVI